jgi:hypothetical protein
LDACHIPPERVRANPPSPTATHAVELGQLIEMMGCEVPEASATHVVPLEVERTSPPLATATQLVAPEQAIAASVMSAPAKGFDWNDQFAPLSTVR